MKTYASKLAVAAVLAASAPALASANDDCDHHGYNPPVAYPSQPEPAPYAWRHGSWHERHGSWRERELARIRAESQALEARRAEFHARFGWHPRKVRRFERWYAAERAALDRRWQELQYYYAWR